MMSVATAPEATQARRPEVLPHLTTRCPAVRSESRNECDGLLPLKKGLRNGMHGRQRAIPRCLDVDAVDEVLIKRFRLDSTST
jgi:hypothetical protein